MNLPRSADRIRFGSWPRNQGSPGDQLVQRSGDPGEGATVTATQAWLDVRFAGHALVSAPCCSRTRSRCSSTSSGSRLLLGGVLVQLRVPDPEVNRAMFAGAAARARHGYWFLGSGAGRIRPMSVPQLVAESIITVFIAIVVVHQPEVRVDPARTLGPDRRSDARQYRDRGLLAVRLAQTWRCADEAVGAGGLRPARVSRAGGGRCAADRRAVFGSPADSRTSISRASSVSFGAAVCCAASVVRTAATGWPGRPRRSASPTSSGRWTVNWPTSGAAAPSTWSTWAASALQEVWIALRASERAILEGVTLAHVAAGTLPHSVSALVANPSAWSLTSTSSRELPLPSPIVRHLSHIMRRAWFPTGSAVRGLVRSS